MKILKGGEMKKPKKENLNNIPTYKCGFKNYDIATGFNEGLEVSEKYHLWDIKTNYTHKDRLNKVRIERLLIVNWKTVSLKQLTFEGMIFELANLLSNQLKG